jgi:hypothetical protein
VRPLHNDGKLVRLHLAGAGERMLEKRAGGSLARSGGTLARWKVAGGGARTAPRADANPTKSATPGAPWLEHSTRYSRPPGCSAAQATCHSALTQPHSQRPLEKHLRWTPELKQDVETKTGWRTTTGKRAEIARAHTQMPSTVMGSSFSSCLLGTCSRQQSVPRLAGGALR